MLDCNYMYFFHNIKINEFMYKAPEAQKSLSVRSVRRIHRLLGALKKTKRNVSSS